MAKYLNLSIKNDQITRQKRVILLEDLDFVWDEKDLRSLSEIWKEGIDIKSIAKYFKRDPDEILLALIHLARRGRIEKRKGGLLGW